MMRFTIPNCTLNERWNKVMESGVTKEITKELMEKYPTSKKLRILRASATHFKVKAIMRRLSIKIDSIQNAMQRQLGAGIYVVGTVASKIREHHDKKLKVPLDASQFFPKLRDAF